MRVDEVKYLPLIPLRDIVVFPGIMVPFVVGREASLNALKRAHETDRLIFLATQRDASIDVPMPKDIFTTGVISRIVHVAEAGTKTVKVVVQGIERARIVEFAFTRPYIAVGVKPLQKIEVPPEEVAKLVQKVLSQLDRYNKLRQQKTEVIISPGAKADPDKIADIVAAQLVSISIEERQNLLEIINPAERLMRISFILESEVNKLSKKKRKTSSEPFVREGENEIEALRRRIEETRMPKDAKEKAYKELERLENMPPMTAESSVSRTYLDWLLSMPWYKKSRESKDLKKAARILDEDHYGLQKVKERILEYLAIRQLVKKPKGAILCFVGPPGVGKSSLARSIARATGRKFVRVSLGGVRDEAEIRGHRRTYIGAYPGQIIQGIKRAGVKNPVFLLDEIDKLSADFRGDPAAALMEVLDPEQNNAFVDHYLDTGFDLSEVMFITTANYLEGIPKPLQDRMEIIEIPGYTEIEKLHIARDYLIPKQIKQHGITDKNLKFTDEAILAIIRSYTKEAGVRSLEREIANICRKIARKVAEEGSDYSETITPDKLRKYLGIPKYYYQKLEGEAEVGVATGLAWTEYGGDILQIEAVFVKGKGQLILTGRLGEVMKESAQTAFTFVRSKLSSLGFDITTYKEFDIHLHVPEGAVPKEGPSAGITIAVALMSLFTAIPARIDIAMTGEVTLRGKVLKIGGLKEKLIAAHRVKIKEVIIPEDNKAELEEVPEEVRKDLKLHFVKNMDQVFDLVLKERISIIKDKNLPRFTSPGAAN